MPLALLLLAASFAAGAEAGPEGVDLLSAGPGTIRFGVALEPVQLIPSSNSPGSKIPVIPGWGRNGLPGAPAIPARIVQVAVPPTGGVTVRGFGSGEASQSGVVLEPVPVAPGGASRPGAEPILEYRRDRSAYESPASAAPERARLVGVSWLRNQRVASIAVLPVDYQPRAGRLTTWSRIEVEVDVTPSAPVSSPAERSDPFESVYRSALVNYEQGKSWRRPAISARAGVGSLLGLGGGIQSATLDSSSVFAGHRWLKIAIPQTGFYRVSFSQIKTLVPFTDSVSVAFGNVRLFGWPGLPVLPENTPCDTCDYREIAFGVEDAGGDGRMSVNADAIYFYALGPQDWANLYDPTAADSVFAYNPYDLHSYVYLSYGRPDLPYAEPAFPGSPQRIRLQGVTLVNNGTENRPTTSLTRLHLEQDVGSEYYPSFSPHFALLDPTLYWDKFFWRTMTTGANFAVQVRLPGIDPTLPAQVRARSWGVQVDQPGPCGLYPQHLLSLAAGNDSTQVSFTDLRPVTARIFPLLDTLDVIRLQVPNLTCSGNRIDQSALSFIEVKYRRQFVPDGDQLSFESPGNGNAIYQIGPFDAAAPPRLFDVTDPFSPVELIGFDYSLVSGQTSQWTLSFEVVETGPRRYAMLPSASFAKPSANDITEASDESRFNLRSSNQQADYLLIYYDGFKQAADSLLNWRRVRLPLPGNPGPYDVRSVPISAVYDQFSGGRTDPDAIRNFLRFAFFNWRPGGHSPPAFVTLLGDASFDFKNLLGLALPGQPGCLMPAFENNYTSPSQFASDDWLMNVDTIGTTTVLPDFFAGRIPADDPGSALDYLQKKLFFYERSAPTGTFRNRVMLIADDDQQGESPDYLEWTHLRQTAVLDTVYTPDHFDRVYVYLHTYPDGPGRTKPGAKADIKNNINGEGVAIFNFIGHGSPFKLSDENVLIDTDAGSFTNSTRLPLFIAASCDVGKFNDPRVQSLGERLLMSPTGGSVGVISATELAYSDFNVDLAYRLYTLLYSRDATTGQYQEGVVPALLSAKLQTSSDLIQMQNNEKYGLMGDAALRLDLPKLWVDVGLYDATGTTPVTQIHGGDAILFKGRVLDRPGGSAVGYSGVGDLLIEDSQPRPTSPACVYDSLCARTQYDFKAGAIFRGSVLVSGGLFQGKFIVPLEALGGPRGKVRAYLAGLAGTRGIPDAVGSIRMQISPGSIPAGDQAGPSIALSFPGGATSVRPDATLNVDLSDPSGILTTGHTLQNGIIVTVDNNTTQRSDITSTFRYAAGSYSTGTAQFQLPNLSPGSHTVSVSAADNLAAGLTAFEHRSSSSLSFQVASAPPVVINRAYLFPNPTESGRLTSGGEFVIVGPGDSVNVLVKIFTVSGRLIRELESFGDFGQVQIPWNGLDAEGGPLANGTYLFKVYVNGRDDQGRSSAQRKASAEGRFVILNR